MQFLAKACKASNSLSSSWIIKYYSLTGESWCQGLCENSSHCLTIVWSRRTCQNRKYILTFTTLHPHLPSLIGRNYYEYCMECIVQSTGSYPSLLNTLFRTHKRKLFLINSFVTFIRYLLPLKNIALHWIIKWLHPLQMISPITGGGRWLIFDDFILNQCLWYVSFTDTHLTDSNVRLSWSWTRTMSHLNILNRLIRTTSRLLMFRDWSGWRVETR